MTEVSRHDEFPSELRAGRVRWSVASQPWVGVQPHLEVKVVAADGRIVRRGQTGELLTRGYSVMLGYWYRCTRCRTRHPYISAYARVASTIEAPRPARTCTVTR